MAAEPAATPIYLYHPTNGDTFIISTEGRTKEDQDAALRAFARSGYVVVTETEFIEHRYAQVQRNALLRALRW